MRFRLYKHLRDQNDPAGVLLVKRLLDRECYISGTRGDPADPGSGRLRYTDTACASSCNKCLFGKQGPADTSGICLKLQSGSIAFIQLYVACSPFDDHFSGCDHIGQRDISGVPFRTKASAGNVRQYGFSGADDDYDISVTGDGTGFHFTC